LKLDPVKETLINGFSRDVTNIGHWGTGDLEVTITDDTTYEQAKNLIEKAYFNN
jgi:predicted transport protein